MGKRDKTTNANSVGHSINGKARKAERRAAAFARYEATKHLTVKQKLDRINGVNPNGAKRQRARYEAILAAQADKKSEEVKQAKNKERKEAAKKETAAT